MKHAVVLLTLLIPLLQSCTRGSLPDQRYLPKEGYYNRERGEVVDPQPTQQRPSGVRSTQGSMGTVEGFIKQTPYGLILEDQRSDRMFSISNDEKATAFLNQRVRISGHISMQRNSVEITTIQNQTPQEPQGIQERGR